MKLYSETHGQGPDLVLLHGWGMHGAIWQPLLPPLAAHFRVTCIDLPGHGLSTATDDRGGLLSLDDAADLIAERLPPGCLLAGWSLGGLLAQQVACRHDSDVRALILIATTPRFVTTADWPHAMNPATLAAFADNLASEPAATLKRFLALQLRGTDNERQLLRTLLDLLGQRPAALDGSLQQGLALLQHGDLRHCLPALRIPLLWLFGEHDRLVPPGVADDIRALHGHSDIRILAGAGHAPFLSDPERTAQLIQELADA